MLLSYVVICLAGAVWPGPGMEASFAYAAELPTTAVLQTGALEGMLDPDQYVLGPGDVLEIGFWGDVNRQELVTVNPDGDLLVSPVGPVRVAGSTLAEVRSLVKSVLSDYYRPNILSVSLVSLRTFKVHVAGMVEVPGAVEVNGAARVSQAVAMAGGVLEEGSQRNIIVRRGDEILRVDLRRYTDLGDNAVNPFLRDGDAVYIPPVMGWVWVYGSVGRPGSFEFVDGETAADVLTLAGGMRPEAYRAEIEVERFDPVDSDTSRQYLLAGEQAALEGFELQLGDRVFVRTIPGWHRDTKVDITGEVRFPGTYVIEEGKETLSGLISRAGGLTEKASLAEARLIRGSYAARPEAVEGEIAALGEIQDSFDDRERDLLKTMGRETKGLVAVRFDEVLIERNRSKDPLLYGGDVIDIPKASNFVRVAGQVKTPGLVPLTEGSGYRDYVRAAGGFAPGADRGAATLIRAAGGVRVYPWREEVRPGDIIWVPERPERDWWQVTKDVFSLAAQVATIWLVIDSVRTK